MDKRTRRFSFADDPLFPLPVVDYLHGFHLRLDQTDPFNDASWFIALVTALVILSFMRSTHERRFQLLGAPLASSDAQGECEPDPGRVDGLLGGGSWPALVKYVKTMPY